MAVSTCSKCGGHSFELALFTPLGDSRKLTLVQCSACGVAVGLADQIVQRLALTAHGEGAVGSTGLDQDVAMVVRVRHQ